MAHQEARCSLCPDAGNAGIPIRGVAEERQIIRGQLRSDSKFGAHALRVPNGLALAIHLHDAIPLDTLRKILVGCPNADLLDARILGGEGSGRSQPIVSLEFAHRPDGDTHVGKGVLEWFKLCEEGGLNALAGLVAAPKLVAEGFDDMVRGYPYMRRTFLDHLQDGVEQTDDGAERPILALGEAAQAIEVAKQLVGSVDEMNDHQALLPSDAVPATRAARTRARTRPSELYQAEPHGVRHRIGAAGLSPTVSWTSAGSSARRKISLMVDPTVSGPSARNSIRTP